MATNGPADVAILSEVINGALTVFRVPKLQEAGEMTPKARNRKDVDPTQSWFWSPQWAVREREADTDYRAGRITIAESVDKAITTLKEAISTRKNK